MKIIKPNSPIQVIDGISIFLAGTIDNGKSIGKWKWKVY